MRGLPFLDLAGTISFADPDLFFGMHLCERPTIARLAPHSLHRSIMPLFRQCEPLATRGLHVDEDLHDVFCEVR